MLSATAQCEAARLEPRAGVTHLRGLKLNLWIEPKKRLVRDISRVIDGFHWGALRNGRSFRLFNVVDDFNRHGLGIQAELSLPSARVARSLHQIIE